MDVAWRGDNGGLRDGDVAMADVVAVVVVITDDQKRSVMRRADGRSRCDVGQECTASKEMRSKDQGRRMQGKGWGVNEIG